MNNKNSVKNQVALLRVQVRSIIDEANASMPAERQVHLKSALAVIKRSLDTTRSLAFEVREFQALRELSSFITLAQKNKSLNAQPKNTDLLPVGHPASTASHAMTASALRNAQIQWLLSDVRISDDAKPLLASAFSAVPDSPEHKYAMTRLSLMTESKVPLEALVAAFGDGNSVAARRARAMLQRRDRKGRFAYQGGGISALIKRANGVVERLTGHTVSSSPDGKTVRVELPNGKLVDVPVDSGEFIKAVLNPTADGFSGVPAKHSASDTVVDEASLQYYEAPHGFHPDDSHTGAGKGYTDDSYNVVKNDDGTFSISQRGTGVDLGTANSWSEVQKTLQSDDANLAKAEGSQPIAHLTDQQINDMYDPSKNPLDVKSPFETPADITPAKGAPDGFEYSYPDGAYKLSPHQDAWEPEGHDGQDSSDYTDDPKVIAGKWKAEGLVARLKMAIIPQKEGSNATGYAPLPFNEGLEQVPAEAVYAALDEKGLDAKMEVAKIYDEALGTTENQDALTAAREAAKTVTPEATLPEDVTPVEPEKGKGKKEAELPKPDVENLPLTVPQKIAWFIEAFAGSKGFFDTPKPTNQMIYEYIKDTDVPHEDLVKALEDAGIEIAPDPEADVTAETPTPEDLTPSDLVDGAPEPTAPEPTNEPDVADIVDEISSGDPTDEEIQAMLDGEGIGEGDVPGVFVADGNLQEIPFDTATFVLDDPANPNGPGHVEKSSGTSNIIDFAGRKIVIVDVNGVKVPFYLSTGDGGKKNVPAGKWYPFLGVGSDGWINKDGKRMTDYYGSPELKAQAEWLDANIGDVRKDDTIPKVSPTGSHIDAINADLMAPTDNGHADTQKNIDAAVADLVERVKTGEIATPEEVKSKKATKETKAVLPEAPSGPEETPSTPLDTADLEKPILPPSEALPSGPTGLKPEPMGPETPKTPNALPEGWTPVGGEGVDSNNPTSITKTLEDGTTIIASINTDGTYTVTNTSLPYSYMLKYANSMDKPVTEISTMRGIDKTHPNLDSLEQTVLDRLNVHYADERSNLVDLLNKSMFDSETIDSFLNASSAEEAKKIILDSERYKIMQKHFDELQTPNPFAATNTVANNNAFKKKFSNLNTSLDRLAGPFPVDESKIDPILPQNKPEVLTPTNAPVAMTEKVGDPVKVTTSVSDLQAGDVLANDFFTVESVYSDAESEAKKPGSVWVTGYYPGHASQKTKLWNPSDSREVFRNVDAPAKGDLPELSKPFAKDYDPEGKVYKDTALDLFVPKDAEARSKYLDAVDQYNAQLKEAMGKWTAPADAPSHDATATDPSAPHKLSVPASDLQPGDIAFRVEDPGYSGGVLKEPYTNYFVIEEVFTDENTPSGKVNVRGYYPGHVSQVREWNKDTPIDAVRGDKNVPQKGDGPELVLKKQKEYPVDPTTKKMTPETRAEWLKNVEDFHAGAKASAANYTDPVGDYIAGDTTPPPTTAVATAPKKPGRAPAQPAFQGDRLVELAKQANGDPKKFMELLAQEEIAFFDYETVGDGSFGPDSAPIQLAAHKIKDGKVVDSFDMFINPGKPLGEYYYQAELDGNGKQKKDANGNVIFILDENGNKVLKGSLKNPDGEPVNDEWLAQQPTLEEAHKAFAEWLGEGAILGGQNITGFDIPILKYQFEKAGLTFNAGGIVDTLPLAQSITKVPPHTKGVNTLEGLAARYGIDLTNAHNAAADSLATHGVLFAMLDEVSKTNDAEALTHLDPETKFAEYEGKFADWQAAREAFKAWTAAQALKDAEAKIADGKTVSLDDLVKSASVPEVPNPDGIFNTKKDAINPPEGFPTGPAVKDSPEWVKDENNTTLIEDTIRPTDFKVGDFIPAEHGGFHEILSIEQDPNKKDFFNIATRVVGTDNTYVKNWFKYNKNYSGVRRPNNSLDGSEMPVLESTDVAPDPMPEAPAKWNNYDIKQNDHGNFYADGITSEDAIKLRTGELQPPSLPFFVPMYENTDPNSGEGDLYTEQSIAEGGPRKYWGQFGGAGILVRRKNADGNYEYLLARRSGTSSGDGKWAYFGGAHDTAEAAKDPEATVLKELGEEAGIDLTGKVNFAHTHDSTGDPDWSYKTLIADVGPDAIGPDDIKTNWEHSTHGWFTADQIKDMGSKGLLFGPFAGSAEAILNTSSDESNTPATPAPADAVASATPEELGTVFDVSNWKKVGEAGGSTGGAIYEDQNGNTFFVKPPNNVDDTSDPERHARNEALASALYAEAGVKSGRIFLGKDENGDTVLVSPWVDGSTNDFKAQMSDPAILAKAQEAFAVDAWLMNWDSVGLVYDNMLMNNGDVVRVDPGGSLLYRARGKSKQDQMSDKVTEIDSLRSGQNAQAAKVFGPMTDAQLAESAKLVQAITPERINQIVDAAFPDDKATADFLKQKLTARRQDLIDRFNLSEPVTPASQPDAVAPSVKEATPEAPSGPEVPKADVPGNILPGDQNPPTPPSEQTPTGPTHTVDVSQLHPAVSQLANSFLNTPEYADAKIENYSSPEDGVGFSLTDPKTGVKHIFAYKEGPNGEEIYSAYGTYLGEDGNRFQLLSPTYAESKNPDYPSIPSSKFKNAGAAASAFIENIKEQNYVFHMEGMFEAEAAEKNALQAKHLDPAQELTQQIADAIDAGKMVAFKYHDKERLVTPHGTWENPQNGNVNFSATEMIDGKPVKKTFTLSKIEKSDNAPSTPDATADSGSSLDMTKLPVPMKKLAEKYMALPKYSKWKFENFDESTGASEGETGLTITDPESGIKYQFSYNDGSNGEHQAFSAMAWAMNPDSKSISTMAPKDENGNILAPGVVGYEFEGIEQARQRFDALMKNSDTFTAALAKKNETAAKKQESSGDQETSPISSTTPEPKVNTNQYAQEMYELGVAIGEYVSDAFEGNEDYFRLTTSKGDTVTVINQGNGVFDVVAYSGRDINGEEPIDLGSYDNLTDATNTFYNAVSAINANNIQSNPVPIPELFVESEEDSQTPISDIVTTALDGADTPIPSVDEIINETAVEVKAKAVTNPDLIIELLKKNHPEHSVLSNGDLLVRSKKINGDTYDTIVRRNSDNTFSVYLRETNGITGAVREVHYAAKRHSELAINNLINNRNSTLDSKTNPKSWFTSKKAKTVENPSQPSTEPTVTQAANDVIKPEFPQTGDLMVDGLLKVIEAAANEPGGVQKVLDSLQNMPGISQETFDNLMSIVNTALAKQSASVPVPDTEDYNPYVSKDGKTIVKIGDTVRWEKTKDGVVIDVQIGVVEKYKNTQVTVNEYGEYIHDDYVTVRVPGYAKALTRVSSNLEVLSSAPDAETIDGAVNIAEVDKPILPASESIPSGPSGLKPEVQTPNTPEVAPDTKNMLTKDMSVEDISSELDNAFKKAKIDSTINVETNSDGTQVIKLDTSEDDHFSIIKKPNGVISYKWENPSHDTNASYTGQPNDSMFDLVESLLEDYLGKLPAGTSETPSTPEASNAPLGKIHLDPEGDMKAQIQDAIDNQREISFLYDGKERSFIPEAVYTHNNTGNDLVNGVEGGFKKKFNLAKIEKSADFQPYVPSPEKPRPDVIPEDIVSINPETQIATEAEKITPSKILMTGQYAHVTASNGVNVLVPNSEIANATLWASTESFATEAKNLAQNEMAVVIGSDGEPGLWIVLDSKAGPDVTTITMVNYDAKLKSLVKKDFVFDNNKYTPITARISKNGGDGGGGNPPEVDPINPTNGPATVQETADVLSSVSEGIKNDPSMSGVDTASMDDAVDAATKFDEESGQPKAEVVYPELTYTPDASTLEEWQKFIEDNYVTEPGITKVTDLKPNSLLLGSNNVNIVVVSAEEVPAGGNYGQDIVEVRGFVLATGESVVKKYTVGKSAHIKNHKDTLGEDPYATVPAVTHEETKDFKKKTSKWQNIKNLSYEELKVGDVFVKKTGPSGYSYQILSITPSPTRGYPTAVVRFIAHDPAKWPVNNGRLMHEHLDKYYKGYNNVKRPKQEWFDAAEKAAGVTKKPEVKVDTTVKDGVTVFNSVEDLTANALDKKDSSFLELFGADSYSANSNLEQVSFKQGTTGLLVKDSGGPGSGKNILPGIVVKDSKGNSGIVTNTYKGPEHKDSTLDVTWLAGPDAGSSQSAIKAFDVTSTDKFIKYDDAQKLGVTVNPDIMEKIKSNLSAIAIQQEAALKLKKEQEEAKKAIEKLKNENQIQGSGSTPVVITGPVDWSSVEFSDIPNLPSVIEAVQSDMKKASVGVQTLVDSDSIEDNTVRVYRVQDKDGNWRTRVRFKLTDWAGVAKAEELISSGVSGTNGIEFRKYEKQTDGSILNIGVHPRAWIDEYRLGTTYTLDIKDEQGNVIGETLIHRATKTAETINYKKSAHSGEAASYNNEVDIYLPDNATPQQVEQALKQAGVTQARPATQEDIKILAENKIIGLFTDKADGSKNYKGELREKVLQSVKDRWGIDAADIKPEVINNGDIVLLMPEDVAEKISIETKSPFFIHSWQTNQHLPPTGKERAKFFFDLFTGDGLRSTVDRWASGVNVKGKSSIEDGYAVGANYVFTAKSTYSSGTFNFDGKKLLRRLDFYANSSDAFGKKSSKDVLEEMTGSEIYEILFKGTVSWADLSRVHLDISTRDELLDMLAQAGIGDFGGTPITEIFGLK